MDFTEVKCRSCGAAMRVPDGATRVRCNYCGTEYVLSAKRQAPEYNPVKTIHYKGRKEYLYTYLPQNWTLRVIEDSQSFSMYAAVCNGLRLDSPDHAQMLFYPFAYFQDFTPGGFGIRQNYYLDGLSGTRYRRRVDMGPYLSERLQELFGGLHNLRLEPADDKNGVIRRRADMFSRDAEKVLGGATVGNYAKVKFSFLRNGSPYSGFFATALTGLRQRPRSQGGDFLQGLLNLGGMMGMPTAKADWGRAFDFALLAPAGSADRYADVFDSFCTATRYGQSYYDMQNEEVQNVRQIQLQGAQYRQQNAINAQRQLHRTMSETTDIINSGYEERSRVMDRMDRKYSEAVRGVNTYTDASGGEFQANVDYDHVYQRGSTFVGSKDGGVELGPDWQELKRKD